MVVLGQRNKWSICYLDLISGSSFINCCQQSSTVNAITTFGGSLVQLTLIASPEKGLQDTIFYRMVVKLTTVTSDPF